MKGLLALAVIAAFASGLIGTWAFSQLTEQAGAVPPPQNQQSAQKVREQNLDSSGFIRVHEQGTANVNVTNGSLPVSGTVNVGNFPAAPQGRLMLVADNVNIVQNTSFTTPFVDTADCRKLALLTRHSGGLNATLLPSADGQSASGVVGMGLSSVAGGGAYAMAEVAVPKSAISFSTTSASVTIDKAWLFCSQ